MNVLHVRFLILIFAGWVIRAQQGVIDYLQAENRVLREQLRGKHLLFTRHGILIDYVEPGKPNQNAYIERFNRSYREEILDTWVFRDLNEVRELSWAWMIEYNEERDHDGLGGFTPAEVLQQS